MLWIFQIVEWVWQRERGVCPTYSRWGEYIRGNVNLLYETYIRGVCRGTITTRGWRRHSVSHMILVCMETVGFKGRIIFEIWIEIQGCGRMGLVVLKVTGDNLEWGSNCTQKFLGG